MISWKVKTDTYSPHAFSETPYILEIVPILPDNNCKLVHPISCIKFNAFNSLYDCPLTVTIHYAHENPNQKELSTDYSEIAKFHLKNLLVKQGFPKHNDRFMIRGYKFNVNQFLDYCSSSHKRKFKSHLDQTDTTLAMEIIDQFAHFDDDIVRDISKRLQINFTPIKDKRRIYFLHSLSCVDLNSENNIELQIEKTKEILTLLKEQQKWLANAPNKSHQTKEPEKPYEIPITQRSKF